MPNNNINYKVNKICLDNDGKWHNAEGNRELVSPTVGDLIDVLCSENNWREEIYKLKLDFVPLIGTSDFVKIIPFSAKTQHKIVTRGFNSRRQ